MGNVVEEFKLGETTIIICDDYCCGKTKEEVDLILEHIADTFITYLQRNTA